MIKLIRPHANETSLSNKLLDADKQENTIIYV